jgi:hypothetical protein
MEGYQLEASPEDSLSTPNQNLQSQTSWGYQAGSQTSEVIDEIQICQAFGGQTGNAG